VKHWLTETKAGNVTWRIGAALLSGSMWFLACADFDIWPLAWIAMVPTLWAIRGQKAKPAFWYAYLAGIVANAGGFYWIVGLLERFGNMPTIAALPIFLLMAAYQGIEFGLFGWWISVLERRTHSGATWFAPVLMVAIELVTPLIFPWYLAITQAWVVPVIQVADLAGPLGVTFLLLVANGAVYDLLDAAAAHKKIPWRRASIAAGVLVAALVYGQIRLHQVRSTMKQAEHIKIGVVQGNFGINLKGQKGYLAKQLQVHQAVSHFLKEQGAKLIVWPESSYPYPIDRNITSASELPPAIQFAPDLGIPMIIGAITVKWSKQNRPNKVFNSALMVDAQGRVTGVYDKMYLLIFGEYIPFHDELSFMKKFFEHHRMSHFDRGKKVTTFPLEYKDNSYRIGPLICYEDIITSFGRALADHKPNLLVNITNDAWFGNTSEPYEHLALAVYRSVEHRLALVRAVNTGVSTIVLPTGKLGQETPTTGSKTPPGNALDPAIAMETAGFKRLSKGLYQARSWPHPHALLVTAPLMPAHETVYAKVGDIFGYANLLLTIYLLVFFKRKTWRKLFKRQYVRSTSGTETQDEKSSKQGGTKAKAALKTPQKGKRKKQTKAPKSSKKTGRQSS